MTKHNKGRTSANGMQRREFLQYAGAGALAGAVGLGVSACAQPRAAAKADRSLLSTYPTLSKKTQDWRWGRIRKMMETNNVEALLVMGGEPSEYLTNWRGHGAILLFPLIGDPIAFSPTTWGAMSVDYFMKSEAAGIEFWVRDWRFGQGTPDDLVEALKEKQLTSSRIGTVGVERTGYFDILPRANRLKERALNERALGVRKADGGGLGNFLKTQLPKITTVELWDEYVRLWLVKNEEELAMFRKAAAALEVKTELIAAACKPGNTLADIRAAGVAELLPYGVDLGFGWIGGGPDGGREPAWSAHGLKPPVIQKGDLVTAEFSANVGSLNAQICLTVSVGEPTSKAKELAALARESFEIGLKTLRPGIRFRELAEAMAKPNQRTGAWQQSPLCHTLNPNVAISAITAGIYGERGFPGMKERFGEVKQPEMPAQGGDLVLEENMAFQLEPPSSYERTFVIVGGSVLLTKNGVEDLTPMCSRLIVVDA